jgi:hypothetical protein
MPGLQPGGHITEAAMKSEAEKRVFTITELAGFIGCSRYQMARLLVEKGVRIEHIGRKKMILLWDLTAAFPNLWSTITLERCTP